MFCLLYDDPFVVIGPTLGGGLSLFHMVVSVIVVFKHLVHTLHQDKNDDERVYLTLVQSDLRIHLQFLCLDWFTISLLTSLINSLTFIQTKCSTISNEPLNQLLIIPSTDQSTFDRSTDRLLDEHYF